MNRPAEFDRFAADYRRIHSDNVRISGVESDYFCRHKIEQIQKTEPHGDISLLDFGCGDGALAAPFVTHFPQGRYTGIDVSGRSIAVACQRNLKDCRYFHDNGNGFSLEAAQFDVAVAANVFHHIPHRDHRRHLERIARWLKPGGRVYIFEHNPFNPATRWIVATCVFDEQAVLVRPEAMKKTLAAAGFRTIDLRYLLFFPRIGPLQRLLTLEDRMAKLPLGAQYLVRGMVAHGDQPAGAMDHGCPARTRLNQSEGD